MQNYSKYFLSDLVSTTQTLKPLIIIADSENNIISSFSQDQQQVYDNDGNIVTFINAISKVSNVKISNDYDTKKLKINRLRCVFYNYYDVNKKLTEHFSNNIINKNIYLFYKSPTTNVVNISEQIRSDYECALVYRGQISRISHNDNTIEITAEDRTQIKIANKTVPYLSVDKLDYQKRERLLSEYRDTDLTVPMTFGKVDKAYTLPSLSVINSRIMDIDLDFHPTSSNYTTSKIPKLFEKTPVYENPYCLYVKRDEDYLIINHDTSSVYQQNQKNSKIELYSNQYNNQEYYIPALQYQDESQVFNLWSFGGYHLRQVQSVVADDGSIFDIAEVVSQSVDNNLVNIEKINDNGGYEKKWYRSEDNIFSNSISDNFFDTGLKYFHNTSGSMGKGRWILLKLTEGVSDSLLNLRTFGQWKGNTFLMCDWQMYQSLDETTPNDSLLSESEIERTGFFVAPIDVDMWREKIIPDISLLGPGVSIITRRGYQAQLNRILLKNDEQIAEAEDVDILSADNYLQDAVAPIINTYRDAPIHINRDDIISGQSNYWGSYGNNINQDSELNNIQGTYYGSMGNEQIIRLNEADAHDYIAIFEYFPPFWALNSNYQQGLKMDNIGFVHSVLIEDLQKEEIFASIEGRKNAFFTEQLEYSEEDPVLIDLTLEQIINGADGLNMFALNDEFLLDSFNFIFITLFNNEAQEFTYNNNAGIRFSQKSFVYMQSSFTAFFSSYEWYENQPEGYQPFISYDDSAMNNVFTLWSDYLWKVQCSPLVLYDNISINTNDFLVGAGINYSYLANSESLQKCITAKMLEYLYQADSPYLNNNRFVFEYYDGMQTGEIYEFDITDQLNELMIGNNWNDYGIESFDDWINNFYTYFDNLCYAINKPIFDFVNPFLWYTNFYQGYDAYFASTPYLSNISSIQDQGFYIGDLENAILEYATATIQGEEPPQQQTTDGIIRIPSDIVMNILTNEMEFGKLLDEQVAGQNVIVPNYNNYDIDSITESRNAHNWNMGFSINKKTEGKKLIEDILKESKSYPRFTSDGKFGLMTIRESYTYDDIDKIIDTSDIINYKFEQTKREDIITSVKMFYRFDYGIEKYNNHLELNINSIFPEWAVTGFSDYNINEIDGHKDIELKYHTNELTTQDFATYTIMNNCNQHNIINMKLPLNYIDLEVGDKIHLPLINNEKVFNIDYSKVDFLNEQPIYPLWIIMETNVTTDGINIKAYQLHYLGTDGNHGFEIPEQEYVVRGNMNENNSTKTFTNGDPVPNWNYNVNATEHNGLEIPYFDAQRDGKYTILDIIYLVNIITGNQQADQSVIDRMCSYTHYGQPNFTRIINVVTVISVVNMLYHNPTEN